MEIYQDGEIRYVKFQIFDRNVLQAIFTRHGGVSPKPWATLNMGGTVGDDTRRVIENKRRALETLGRNPNSIYDVWQVHSNSVVVTNKPRIPNSPYVQADAIFTNQVGLTLMMRFADCVPVFLYDPIHKVVGIVHAGWLGVVSGIINAAIKSMRDVFKSIPKYIHAGIGPSIGPDHYEIREDVASRIHSAFNENTSKLLRYSDGKIYFNLWNAVEIQLNSCGINNIENSLICTACQLEDWFSHRAEHGMTGRFGAFISLT